MATFKMKELADAAPKAFEPVPPATYTVEVVAAEAKTYKSGNQGVNVDVAIADEGPYKGRKIRFNTIVFNPENPSTFFSNLRGFGIASEFFDGVEIDTDDSEGLTELMEDVGDEVVGKQASTAVTIEPYQGKSNNKCGFFNPVTAGGTGTRRRRSSGTPDVEAAPPAAAESAPAPAAEGDDEAPAAPRRQRAGRSRRTAEPGMPPGL